MKHAQSASKPAWRTLNFISFDRTVQVLKLIAVLVGVVLGLDQAEKIRATLEESQRSSDIQLWDSVSKQWLAMDAEIAKHPKARAYLFSGKDPSPDDEDYPEAIALSGLVLDFIDYAESSYVFFLRTRKVGGPGVHPEGWTLAFTSMFSSSPILCRAFFNGETEFSSETRALSRQVCASQRPAHVPPT